jgi:signal transduction histidine kinase
MQEMGNSLFTLRMAADSITKGLQAQDNVKLNAYASILYKSYYQLRRLYQHITTLDALSSGKLHGKKRMLDVGQLYEELCRTVEIFTRDKGIALHFQSEQGPFYLMADPDHLEMLLLNLLANSLSHSKAGDSITVQLSRMTNRFLLTVDDQGTGIAPDILSGLFSRSYTPSMTDTSTGAGLGLAVVRGIAEYYGGTLVLESREGAGTSIRVTLAVDYSTQIVVHAPHVDYGVDGMDSILTELSVYLDKDLYNRKMFD